MRWLVAVALLFAAAPARGQTVSVIAPASQGPRTGAVAADLGRAVERALADHPRYRRLNALTLDPDEVRINFDCPALDLTCARRAGSAGGADHVLLSRVFGSGDEVEVRLDLVDVASGRPTSTVHRTFTHRGDLGRALDELVEAVLADPAAIVTADPLLSAPLAPPAAREGPGARRIAAWMTLGAGAVAFAGSAWTGVGLSRTQDRYDRATDGHDLAELTERGRKQALATNVLLVTGALAVGTAVYLFWE